MKIPLSDYDHEDTAPAWLPIRDDQRRALKPIIRCACKSLMGIGKHHVHADGHVTASFYHHWEIDTPEFQLYGPGCGFHEMLELDGYTEHPLYKGREFPPRAEAMS